MHESFLSTIRTEIKKIIWKGATISPEKISEK